MSVVFRWRDRSSGRHPPSAVGIPGCGVSGVPRQHRSQPRQRALPVSRAPLPAALPRCPFPQPFPAALSRSASRRPSSGRIAVTFHRFHQAGASATGGRGTTQSTGRLSNPGPAASTAGRCLFCILPDTTEESDMTAMTALYTASATATGEGRNGHSRSSDGIVDVDLATPGRDGRPRRRDQPRAALRCRLRRLFPQRAEADRPAREVAHRRCRRHRRHLAESRTVPADSAWRRRCTSRCPEWIRRRPMIWSPRPIRCARTPTPPAGTSRSLWTPSSPDQPRRSRPRIGAGQRPVAAGRPAEARR